MEAPQTHSVTRCLILAPSNQVPLDSILSPQTYSLSQLIGRPGHNLDDNCQSHPVGSGQLGKKYILLAL